jgi:hypothetical protein
MIYLLSLERILLLKLLPRQHLAGWLDNGVCYKIGFAERSTGGNCYQSLELLIIAKVIPT